MGSSSEIDNLTGEVNYINETEVDDEQIATALKTQFPEIAALSRWQGQKSRRASGLFQQDKYMSPETIFGKMQVAAGAVRDDDVVSNVADTTEQIAFKRVAIECDDETQESVWSQISQSLDIETYCRKVWREIFTYSQAYPVVIFGKKSYRPEGRTENGRQSKQQFNDLRVPIGLSLLDPLRVIPVGSFMFGNEQLVYIADKAEVDSFNSNIVEPKDKVMSQIIQREYNPTQEEQKKLNDLVGYSTNGRLFTLNPENCWRITATRPDYVRFADVRMESVFELLDLKNLLREMDRQALIGSTNAIILVKKGSDQFPAKKGELDKLATQVKSTARMPIIVGDHRIDIEIITPKTDKTLATERYNGLDSRITARLYQQLSTGNYSTGTATDDSIKLLRVTASSMEARRDSIRDSLMNKIFYPTWESNEKLTDKPYMMFYPRRIALDFDPNIAAFIQDLRDRGDISRETTLGELDIDQGREAVKREREARLYDEVFTPTTVPYGATPQGQDGQNRPDEETEDMPVDKKKEGRRKGGNRNGGGANQKGNGQPLNKG